jgi:hypothetical protein
VVAAVDVKEIEAVGPEPEIGYLEAEQIVFLAIC